MLGQIADHSRIVNPTPSDAFVKQRRAAVEKLVADGSVSVENLEAFVEFAVFGVPSTRGKRHTAATDALVAAIQDSQPSFAADVDANHLDLRLVAGVMIGERLRSEPSDEWNVYIASLVISALLLQPMPKEIYVARLIEDLVKAAKASLAVTSKRLRERRPWPTKEMLDAAGPEASAPAKNGKSALDTFFEVVASNAKADREELDVLWWAFGGRSARTGERFESMADSERALIAATELSDRMLMPPISTAEHLLGSLVTEDTQLSLAELLRHVRKETLLEFVTKKAGVQTVLESQPSLMPLTWLATRLIASELSSGWEAEFEKRTKLKTDTPVSLGNWARQLFAESVAQRLALPLLSEDTDG